MRSLITSFLYSTFVNLATGDSSADTYAPQQRPVAFGPRTNYASRLHRAGRRKEGASRNTFARPLVRFALIATREMR